MHGGMKHTLVWRSSFMRLVMIRGVVSCMLTTHDVDDDALQSDGRTLEVRKLRPLNFSEIKNQGHTFPTLTGSPI